jgi:acyl-CoA thioesterase YciA
MMEKNLKRKPIGELAIRTLAMPADTNPSGDIFGGWVVSQMDLAGISIAVKYTTHRVVTVAIESMSFISPIHVGDFVCCYGEVLKFGRTSMAVRIETWVQIMGAEEMRQVTEGIFTYVAIDKEGRPTPITIKNSS